ncbi:NAD-dependent nucleoside-5'-diphosphate-sugar epimerase/dehydratase [Geotalea daltonii FRC-32]|uniref:NAD-dependent nucleoside-5'-diphosphate-sugar epimerase/dehydratase n=1 Tax=Geotalea daltonii (strain DSM 22248 / JCM 15807 / FRC-32) TaxID=316067 RepID=B9LZS3_GEODF|nr:NAD-dependent epimerase/dehydratase family protein [Geotalea daltonii]ACM18887.1 NAD-dependent nucleoside-5'-diphosphate-sugar epimerase/dehydratase [Geotalea daltonii FRC-32]
MKIFVTGATGLVGKRLVDKLSEGKDEIVCLVRDASRVTFDRNRVRIVNGDLLDKGSYRRHLDGVDLVYNCAAVTGFWGIKWEEYYRNNVEATMSLLQGCSEADVPNFVHVSTTLLHGACDDPAPRKESDPPGTCLSGYEKSKLAAESAVVECGKQTGMSTKIVRLTSVYCAGGRLIPSLVEGLLQNKLKQIGSGKNMKHITHVDDCVDGMMLAARKGLPGAVYNIGAREVPTMGQIMEQVSSALGRERPRMIPQGVARLAATGMEAVACITGKPPLLTRYTVDYLTKNHIYDTSLAAKELGFVAKMDYRQGIANSVLKYLQLRQA